jgi:hypothetical protein
LGTAVDGSGTDAETAWELRLPSRVLLDYNPTTEMLLAHGLIAISEPFGALDRRLATASYFTAISEICSIAG